MEDKSRKKEDKSRPVELFRKSSLWCEQPTDIAALSSSLWKWLVQSMTFAGAPDKPPDPREAASR
jgi:hypothetical protein